MALTPPSHYTHNRGRWPKKKKRKKNKNPKDAQRHRKSKEQRWTKSLVKFFCGSLLVLRNPQQYHNGKQSLGIDHCEGIKQTNKHGRKKTRMKRQKSNRWKKNCLNTRRPSNSSLFQFFLSFQISSHVLTSSPQTQEQEHFLRVGHR